MLYPYNTQESVLNGRLEPCGYVDGFIAELGASGSFCPRHITLPVTASFFSLAEHGGTSPYLVSWNIASQVYPQHDNNSHKIINLSRVRLICLLLGREDTAFQRRGLSKW